MNERDSEAVAAMLRARGYRIVDSEDECDVLLLNTCSVRDAAEQKAIGKAGYLLRKKRHNPDFVLGILGCMAQNRGAELLDRLPDVDLIVGTQKFHRVPDYLDNLRAAREAGVPLGARPSSTPPRSRLPEHDPRPPGVRRSEGLRLRLHPAGLQHGLLLLHRAEDPRRRAFAADGGHRPRMRGAGLPRRPRDHAPRADRDQLRPPRLRPHRRRDALRPAARAVHAIPASSASASPPRTPRLQAGPGRRVRAGCRSSASTCTCRCSRAATGS
jgi:hypothetical protein